MTRTLLPCPRLITSLEANKQLYILSLSSRKERKSRTIVSRFQLILLAMILFHYRASVESRHSIHEPPIRILSRYRTRTTDLYFTTMLVSTPQDVSLQYNWQNQIGYEIDDRSLLIRRLLARAHGQSTLQTAKYYCTTARHATTSCTCVHLAQCVPVCCC